MTKGLRLHIVDSGYERELMGPTLGSRPAMW